MDYQNGLKFVIARAAALAPNPSNPGAMVAIAAVEETVQRHIHNLGIDEQVVIAVFNGKDSHVVSGSASSIESLYAAVKGDGIRSAMLKVDQGSDILCFMSFWISEQCLGFHSACIEPALPELLKWLDEKIVFQPLTIPFYSTVLVNRVPPQHVLDAEYWVRHLVSFILRHSKCRRLSTPEDRCSSIRQPRSSMRINLLASSWILVHSRPCIP